MWTWNAPEYVTGDVYGNDEYRKKYDRTGGQVRDEKAMGRSQPERHDTRSESTERDIERHISDGISHDSTHINRPPLTLEEKRRNAVAYFGSLASYEEQLGGTSHYRIIFTTSHGARNRTLRRITGEFLGQCFPHSPALVTAHRDTAHTHLHIHIASRDTNDKRLVLGQEYFRLDERLLKVAAERLRDSEIYDEHMRLKRETMEHKRGVREDRAAGRNLRPKPDRWSDHWEVENGRVRPFDDRYVGRVLYAGEVARARLENEQMREAPPQDIEQARERYDALAAKNREVIRARGGSHSIAKRELPEPIPTVREHEEMKVLQHETQRLRAKQHMRVVKEISARLDHLAEEYFAEARRTGGREWALDAPQQISAHVAALYETSARALVGEYGELLKEVQCTRSTIERSVRAAVEEELGWQRRSREAREEIEDRLDSHAEDYFGSSTEHTRYALLGTAAEERDRRALTMIMKQALEKYVGDDEAGQTADLFREKVPEIAAGIVADMRDETRSLLGSHVRDVASKEMALKLLVRAAAVRGDGTVEPLRREHAAMARERDRLVGLARENDVEVGAATLGANLQQLIAAKRDEIPDNLWHEMTLRLTPETRGELVGEVKRERDERDERERVERERESDERYMPAMLEDIARLENMQRLTAEQRESKERVEPPREYTLER